MRKRTGRRRLVRGVGAFLSATLIAGSAAIVLGGGVASAATANWSVIGNPTSLAQNTQGNETTNNTVITGASGASAALQFDVPSWTTGQTLAITVAPNDSGHPGKQCSTNPQPEGVNQSDPQAGNYVGFADFRDAPEEGVGNAVYPPLVVSSGVVTQGVGGGPLFSFDVAGEISCSTANPLGDAPSVADASYTTLVLTFLNSGVNGHVQLGNGIGQDPAPQAAWTDHLGHRLRCRDRHGALLRQRERWQRLLDSVGRDRGRPDADGEQPAVAPHSEHDD